MGQVDLSRSLAQVGADFTAEPRARRLRKARVSVVMPTFNEAQNLAATISGLVDFLVPRCAS